MSTLELGKIGRPESPADHYQNQPNIALSGRSAGKPGKRHGGAVGSMTVARDHAAEALRLLREDHRSEETKRAYANDLADFFRSRGYAEATRAAVADLFEAAAEDGALALLLNEYRANLRSRGLAESTVNRRLAAVRALVRMGRRLGAPIPDPAGLVSSEKVTRYKDTRGPGIEAARRLLAAPNRSTPSGQRDFAILLLFCENALRRGELHRCDVGDFNPGENRLQIIGKGKGSEKTAVTLSPAATGALSSYIAARGNPEESEPLFVNYARFSDGRQRLTGRGLFHIVSQYARRALGQHIRPHALRHMAITAYLDATGGDVRGAQRLSRHADLRTLTIYDDNRADLQGKATNLLSALLAGSPEES